MPGRMDVAFDSPCPWSCPVKLKVDGTDGTASFVDSVFFAVIKQSWIWMDNWRFGAVILQQKNFLTHYQQKEIYKLSITSYIIMSL